MEKFCLKWNDFQSNISKSFGSLRQEQDFFDVTLVSDDEQHVSAHKVVLSASSEFFKNILKKATHSSPMIFLSGVSSKNLHSIMDYIYQGEVQLYQEDLNNFLDVATKLKIDGLIGSNEEEQTTGYKDESDDIIIDDDNDDKSEFRRKVPRRSLQPSLSKELDINSSNIDAKAAVDDIVMKVEDGWQCRTCGRKSSSKSSSDIRRHAETHIEGLSFECTICGKSFRSRVVLKNHKTSHSKVSL